MGGGGERLLLSQLRLDSCLVQNFLLLVPSSSMRSQFVQFWKLSDCWSRGIGHNIWFPDGCSFMRGRQSVYAYIPDLPLLQKGDNVLHSCYKNTFFGLNKTWQPWLCCLLLKTREIQISSSSNVKWWEVICLETEVYKESGRTILRSCSLCYCADTQLIPAVCFHKYLLTVCSVCVLKNKLARIYRFVKRRKQAKK